jgi:hypothetical protein
VDRKGLWSTGPPPEKRRCQPRAGTTVARALLPSGLKEPVLAVGLPVTERSSRSISNALPAALTGEAELRNKTYELFDAALYSAGIRKRHRDRYIDRGDSLLALIRGRPAPKALLLNRVIPPSAISGGPQRRPPAPGCNGNCGSASSPTQERPLAPTGVSVRHWTSHSACSTPPQSKSTPGDRQPVGPGYLGDIYSSSYATVMTASISAPFALSSHQIAGRR